MNATYVYSRMRILIDLLHPAHVHFMKNFIWEMKREGHEILVTARKKDVALDLLKAYDIECIQLSTLRKGFIGLPFELLQRAWKTFWIVKKFKPDIIMGNMGPAIAPVGKLFGIPVIVFYNNEQVKFLNWFVYPLASAVITSSSYAGHVNGKHLTYKGYHETAYMHPNWFKPDSSVLNDVGLKKGEEFFILRTVAWQSSHDIGDSGFESIESIVKLINKLKPFGKVLINSEKKLPPQLEPYKVKVPVQKMHSLMYYSKMFIGESATMACEAALIGRPAIFICKTDRGYINELENDYGLAYYFKNQRDAEKKIFELLDKDKSQKGYLDSEWKKRVAKLNSEQNDVTQFIIDFVKNRKWEENNLIKTKGEKNRRKK